MKIFIGFLFMISLTVSANLLMKLGAMGANPNAYAAGLLNWRTISGLGCFAAAGLLYAWLLKWVPLHVAQSIAAVQYVAVVLVSATFLTEVISPFEWLGIGLIATGILIISIST